MDVTHMRRITKLATAKTLMLSFALLLGGCVTVQTSTMFPAGNERISIKATVADIGFGDIPIGGYHVPGSVFVVTTGRDVSKTEGAFGLFGIMSAHGAGKEQAQKQLASAEQALRINLAAPLEQRLKAKVDRHQGSPRFTSGPPAKGTDTLELTPMAFLVVSPDGQTQLQLSVKTRLLNSGGSELWGTRYIYYFPQKRALSGKASWTADGGRLLRKAATESLDQVVNVLLTDSRGPAAGWDNKPVKVTTQFVGIPMTVDGLLLRKTSDTVIFTPRMPTGGLIYGIHILPTKEIRLGSM